MRYWWVNQNKTYKSEVQGGFLWSPKTRKDGARNQFYENMREVDVGDVIFSFCDTRIKAIGVAIGPAETSPKPDFGAAGDSWSKEGWLVPVEFKELCSQICPKDNITLIRPYLPEKYSPLQNSGDGLQSVYLAEVPAPMAAVLADLIGVEYSSALNMSKLTKKRNEELNVIAELADEAIDTSDIPEQTNWSNAQIDRFYSHHKENVEVDSDILDWFKAKSGRYYQQMINKALRDYIQHPPQ